MITINKDYFLQNLIPPLIQKHFSDFEDLAFDIAIAGKEEPRSIFFCTNNSLSVGDFEHADVRANLGRWRLRDMFIATAVVEDSNIDVHRIKRGVKNTEISIKVIGQDTIENKEISSYFISKNAGWELLVRHHSGSLESAIASVRIRNLLISYGILAVLAAGVILLIVNARKAQQLAQQQMEFVAGVSHELRTPLSVIRSAGENIADGVIKEKSQLCQYGGLIRDEGRRLTYLVEQVMAFAGIQSANSKLNKHLQNINKTITDTLAQFESEFKQKNARVETVLQTDLPDCAYDKESMAIVIQNLLTNALKYTSANPEIHITTFYNQDDCTVHITVCDKGIGIESADIKKIFKPFYRTKKALDAQIRGNGLGLSLAKKIIEMHHGQIVVSNQSHRRTCFDIELPVGEIKN